MILLDLSEGELFEDINKLTLAWYREQMTSCQLVTKSELWLTWRHFAEIHVETIEKKCIDDRSAFENELVKRIHARLKSVDKARSNEIWAANDICRRLGLRNVHFSKPDKQESEPGVKEKESDLEKKGEPDVKHDEPEWWLVD